MAKNQRRFMCLLLVMCVLMATSVLAQNDTETPTDAATETATEIATETPTDAPLALPTEEASPLPTDVPSEIPTLAETVTETPTATPTDQEEVTPVETAAPTTDAPVLAAEPPLTLIIRDLFQDMEGVGVLSDAWTVPSGWALSPVSDGAAVQIDAAVAGLTSTARYQDAYQNVAVMGYFTFVTAQGTAQILIRESAAGAYVASLDASGAISLVKQDAAGEVVSFLGTGFVPSMDTSTARGLRVSAMGDVLRVSVDDVEVIAVQDASVLPAGSIRIAVTFPAMVEGQTANGVVLFDNFFVWLPTGDAPIVAVPPTAVVPTETATATEPSVVIIETESTALPTENTPAPTEPTVTVTEETVTPPESASIPFGPMATTNDNFANLFTVGSVPYANTGDTTNNTKEAGEPSPLVACGSSLIGGTAWYKFTPATTASYVISTRGSSFDTVFQVYTSTVANPTLSQITPLVGGCNDDAPGLGSQSQITISLTAATAYYIQVGGLNNRQGTLNFYVARPQDVAVPAAPVISVLSTANPNGGLGNAALTRDTTPRLAWTSSFTAPAYEVEVSSVSNFAAGPNTTHFTTPDRFIEPVPSLGDRVYYWRVRALNYVGQAGAFSGAYSFTLDTTPPPAVTTLTAPAVNAVVLARPTFAWSLVTGVPGVKYRLEIDTNAFNTAPAPLVFSNITLSTTTPSFVLSSSLAQGTYLWRVITVDAAGNESLPSAERSFVVDYRKEPVADRIITAPTTGTTANTARVTFTWTPAPLTPATTRYTIEIDHDANGSADTTLIPAPNTSTVAAVTSGLLPLGDYHYRLVSNTQGMSEWRRFFVSNTLPAAPVLTALAATNNTRPTFAWSASSGINTYQLEYSTSSVFAPASTTAKTVTGATSFVIPADPNDLPDTSGTTYYVHVRGVNAVGAFTAWSGVRTFLLDTEAPAPLNTLTAPANNAIVSTGRPAFSWPAAFGAAGYRFLISQNSTNFDPLIVSPAPSITTPTYTLPAIVSFLKQGRYYWTAAVRDAAGNISDDNPVRTLDVNFATAPTANQVFTLPSKVTFTWVLPAAGRTYKIQVDSNGDNVSDAEYTPASPAGNSIPNVTFAAGAYKYRLIHTTDTSDVSDWRAFFVVSGVAPVAPILNVPPAVTSDTTPAFSWTLAAGQTQDDFELQLSTNAAFSPTTTFTAQNLTPTAGVFNVSIPGSNALPATPETTYYVRVRALNPIGAPTAYSLVRSFVLDTQAPAPLPSLITPTNNTVVPQVRPTFSWPASPAADAINGYIFQLSRVANFSSLVFTSDIAATATSYTLPPSAAYLMQGVYFWRVLPKDAANNRIDDLAQTVENTFTVNYALTPANTQALVPNAATPSQMHVSFTWAAVPATNPPQTGIQVQIATDSGFATIVKSSPNLAPGATSYVTSMGGSLPNANPLPVGQYFWRVVVAGHGTPVSTVYRTFTISGAPATPVLIYPPAVTAPALPPATNNTTPTITWQGVANVSGFELSYSTTSTFTPATTVIVPIADGSVNSHTITPALPLTAGTTYSIRLRAKNGLGVFGSYSATRSFVLDTVAPTAAPTLTAPANNTVVASLKPTLTWAPLAGAVRYNVRYSPDLNETEMMSPYPAVGTSYVPLSNLVPDTYFWRVQAVDAAGNAGPLSEVSTFKVTSTPNTAPTAWNYTTDTPTLTWSALSWATGYQIQISRTSAFASNDIVWSGETLDPSALVSVPLANGTYYWRVRGTASENQVGQYSVIEAFTVDAPN